jgi:predicted transcriptional regulator of viral defense system
MQTLTEAAYKLAPPGSLFTPTVVRNLFPDRTDGARELLVDRATDAGEVLRLKRGLYMLAPAYSRSNPHPFAVAAMLHSPSHVSLETALGFHGMIPEAVYQVASVTSLRSRRFDTPIGVFTFQHVPARAPLAGVEARKILDIYWAFVASPLRALADMVYLDRSVSWSGGGMRWLLESLRIEPDDLRGIAFDRCDEIVDAFGSRRVKAFLQGMRKEIGS